MKISPRKVYDNPEQAVNPGKFGKNKADKIAESEEAPSKSQLKRDAKALKSLASKLLTLNNRKLALIPLDNDVLESILEARQIRSHGARRRQLQYISKLLRRTDPTDILDAVNGIDTEARGLTARHHRSEVWRDVLMEQGDVALGQLLEQRSTVDVQKLRQLIRNARNEKTAGKPPSASRALFRELRDMDEQQNLPPCP